MHVGVEVLRFAAEACERTVGWECRAELLKQGLMLRASKHLAWNPRHLSRARILSWEQIAKVDRPTELIVNTLREMTGSYLRKIEKC